MSNVNVTELRHNLPAYLAKVQRGARLKVTSRGRVIAEIVPPVAEGEQAAAARQRLHSSVVRFDRPLDPVLATEEWEMNR